MDFHDELLERVLELFADAGAGCDAATLTKVGLPGELVGAVTVFLKRARWHVTDPDRPCPTWYEMEELLAEVEAIAEAAALETSSHLTTANVSKVHQALLVLARSDNQLTITAIAGLVGCKKQTLSGSPRFRKAWQMKRELAFIPRGSKSKDGDLEAWQSE